VITDTIVADGIVFYVSRGATGSINADAELAAGLKASLKAQGFFVTERGIELHRPVFVAYKPLPKMKKS
jgi:hypothetical protein